MDEVWYIHEPPGDTAIDRDDGVELCQGRALVEPDIDIDLQMLRKEEEDSGDHFCGEMSDGSS